MEIYSLQEFKKPSLMQRLFGKIPMENGMIEINNLLAVHQADIEKISFDNIVDIAEKYKINLKKKFKSNRLELFSKYLHHCLIDSKLEESELHALKHKTETDVLDLIRKITKDIENKKDLADFQIKMELKPGLGKALAKSVILEPNINGIGFSFNKLKDFLK